MDPSEIPHKITDIQEKLHKSIIRQLRTAITGDPDRFLYLKIKIFMNVLDILNRRVRDNMDDVHVQTKLKQVDAFSFALGVMLTLFVEFIVLARPEYYPMLMYFLMPLLLILR